MAVYKSTHPAHSHVLEHRNLEALRRAVQALKGSAVAVRRSKEVLEQSREIVKHSEKLQSTFDSFKNAKQAAR